MTHFSDADTERGVAEQLATFERGAENIAGARSLANSAAVLWHPDTHFDWVRPGIVLYGASPSGLSADIADTGLQPTMTLTSELIASRRSRRGRRSAMGRRSRRRPGCASASSRAVTRTAIRASRPKARR
jgi:alanine racemase